MQQAIELLPRQKLEEKLNKREIRRFRRTFDDFFELYPTGTIGEYQITDTLGIGRQGLVFELKDNNENEYVAKLVAGNLADADYDSLLNAIRRGLNNSRIIDNPHFPKLLEVIEHEDFFLAIREKAQGKSLAEMVEEKGRLTAKELAPILLSTSEGLEYLHSQDIVHRDIKPEHLIVDDIGFVRIIDMDTSKEKGGEGTSYTSVGSITTRHPLQEIGESNTKCDLYALGCSAAFALEGELKREILMSRITGVSPYKLPERIPEGLKNIVDKLLLVDLTKNYQTVREVKSDLESYVETIIPKHKSKKLTLTTTDISQILSEQTSIIEAAERKTKEFPHLPVISGALIGGVVAASTMPYLLGSIPGMLLTAGACLTSGIITSIPIINHRKRNLQYEQEMLSFLEEEDPTLKDIKFKILDLQYPLFQLSSTKRIILKSQNPFLRWPLIGAKEHERRKKEIGRLERKLFILDPNHERRTAFKPPSLKNDEYRTQLETTIFKQEKELETENCTLRYSNEAASIIFRWRARLNQDEELKGYFHHPLHSLYHQAGFVYFKNEILQSEVSINHSSGTYTVDGKINPQEQQRLRVLYSQAYDILDKAYPKFFPLLLTKVQG